MERRFTHPQGAWRISLNILIVYYTRTGNTRAVAAAIQRQTGGELAEIRPLTPYPAQYHAVLKQAQAEIKAGTRPAVEIGVKDMDAFDTVFVGSPIWWGAVAPPVTAVLAKHDLAGKTVIPFLSHGGGGAGRAESDLIQLRPDAIVKPSLAVRDNGGAVLEGQVAAWLARIGIARD